MPTEAELTQRGCRHPSCGWCAIRDHRVVLRVAPSLELEPGGRSRGCDVGWAGLRNAAGGRGVFCEPLSAPPVGADPRTAS